MPTSPEAASEDQYMEAHAQGFEDGQEYEKVQRSRGALERVRKLAAEDPGWDVSVNPDDLRALLAVVEAAQEVDKLWPSDQWTKHYSKPVIHLKQALAALDSKDAEGAKP